MKNPAQSLVSACSLSLLLACTSLSCLSQDPQQRRIDIGGYKLFTSESGAGKPVVVFESGLGEDISTWNDVQPEIARLTHTFSYDRAGLDKSDPSPHPRSVEQLVSELHAVLHAAGLQPPYILVGHSLGGAIVQLFAHTYPAEIAGLVLVDPEDGRLLDQLQARMAPGDWAARQKAMDAVMPTFSPTQKAELDATKSSGKALAAALPLPDVPVVLLTGTLKDPGFPGNPLEQDLKLELQNQLLAQIPHSRHILVPQSRHYIQNDAPQLVIQSIRDVLAAARQATALAAP